VTVGTTKFDALIQAVDTPEVAAAILDRGYDRLVMQVGDGAYKPRVLVPAGEGSAMSTGGLHVEHFDYAPGLAQHIDGAALVISHAGAGSLFEALAAGKKVVAVPNSLLMHNHQAELAEHLAAMGCCAACEPAGLLETLRRLDLAALVPYERGGPAGIAAAINRVMGFED